MPPVSGMQQRTNRWAHTEDSKLENRIATKPPIPCRVLSKCLPGRHQTGSNPTERVALCDLPAVGKDLKALSAGVLLAGSVPQDRKSMAVIRDVVQAEPIPLAVGPWKVPAAKSKFVTCPSASRQFSACGTVTS